MKMVTVESVKEEGPGSSVFQSPVLFPGTSVCGGGSRGDWVYGDTGVNGRGLGCIEGKLIKIKVL
jgi:hypothetical protein